MCNRSIWNCFIISKWTPFMIFICWYWLHADWSCQQVSKIKWWKIREKEFKTFSRINSIISFCQNKLISKWESINYLITKIVIYLDCLALHLHFVCLKKNVAFYENTMIQEGYRYAFETWLNILLSCSISLRSGPWPCL